MKFPRAQKELQVCRYPQVVYNQFIESQMTTLKCTIAGRRRKRANSCGYTHFGFGTFRRINGLDLVQLRFHVTLGDAVTQ